MAETNTAALRTQGERDARALTVTGRRRADTGRIRRAGKALARMARAVTPETPNGQWLRDNRSFACAAAGDTVAALRHARVRASGGQTALGACCAGLLRACGGALTVKAAEAYLEGFQDALPLETAELALLVPGLQAAVVCALAESYAGDGAAAPALFTSLRALGTAAWGMLAERCDRVGRILARDPVGVYPAMDAATRAHYRQTVARLARRTGRTEIEIAEDVLARAQRSEGARRHVGWFLLREVLGAPEKRRDGGWYIAAVVVGTLFLSLLLGFATKSVSGAVLLLIPVSEVVKGLLDAVLLRVTKPRFVPRLALRRGIPPEGRTLCVIAALLTSPDDAHALCARLEEYYLCNRDALGQLTFGLLADLPEADMAHAPIDPAILRAARAEIAALNARWGSRFYLFTRPRVQTPDGKWSAWERKRGALLELARLVLDRPGTLQCAAGDAAGLSGTVYLLTLDADTRLTPGAARALVGAMLHPLNRAVVDAQRGVVTRGYGLLHPRMATELQSANATDWARVFAGPGGADPYGGACGELYMDCFDRGGFPGKGILDVRALLDCCGGGVIPEGRVLSHDALEGAYLHGGFLGDVELTDTFPAAPLAWGARAHRWIRGDWQNAPWIFSRRARALHPIDRFRLADNLRRSLVAPATWISIFLGCVLRWPGLRLAAYAALLALAQGLIRALGQPIVHPADTRVRYHSDVLHGLASAVAQTVLRLILLPWEAILNTSAIVTALWRMAVSHRNLLQWQTAAQRAGRRDGLGAYWRALWPASALGLLTAVLTPSPTGLAAGIVWMLSPFVLAALGAPNTAGAAPLSRAAQRELLGWAKATWQYFETFCTAEDHYLPPDNVQSQPPTGTAHRTSPTNMGLALVSALGAHALGIDGGQGLALAERMLTTMEQLPRWNGHFYNWYHTCTLRPMPPLYVSTVDSGNCAAALLTAANALRGWGRDELAARAQMLCDGMDFGPLYDPQRRLMHIGIDTGSGKWSESYYDLLSSEARLTSYFAVARGDVPREHWRALSRAQVQKDHYRGCVSWSGSMFEYLMPELFLPPVRDSLLWESAKFCLYVQRRRVRPGQAWGVSESAYFALDSALSYRYKAHGCAALALQPGMDKELVLSPYSSFLALAVEPRAAMRNLRRLAALGLLGQHGFFDALDCTRARTGGGGQIVRCVMAHHQGMSLLAACNALCGDQVRRWFFADPAMRAHATLLSERLPLGAPALRRRAEQPAEKARRRALPDYAAEGTGIDAEAPRCALLIECVGRARITWHTDLVCAGRDADAPAVVTAYTDGMLTAENVRADAPELFCAAAGMPLTGWTCDRFSFLRGQMDARAGAGLSPCFALEGVIDRQGVIVCGCDTRANLLRLTQPDEAAHALRATRERWLGAVSRLWMTTPDADMNRYLGGWAAYQTLCCRLLARTSLYQNGGAFGFRDQLQDAVNLLLLDSAPAREQIGRACAHQFAAGDVCHWWHAGTGPEHGVRTRISDDLLWLPWAVCEYVEKTGDAEILRAEYPFLAGEELEENEHDRYQPLEPGAETGTVLEHCRRALMRVLARGVGAHGLLLIGTGDWNDAFDRVGAQGRGESVWLTWFFAITARKFAALVGGHAAKQLALAADHCTRAAEGAWDGAWYRRGYYDDGRPLGSEACGECRIDAIAQAFAALDTHADRGRVHTALTSAVEHLFDREHNVVRLFDPPITRRTPETGYVRSYGAGLRENGGQYTHGALWLAMALLRTGRTAEGAEILHAMLPAAHDPARYEGEPYVLAADIAGGDNAGVAGWTWYTGAAGWYLRIAAEDLLGLHLRGGVLYPEPHLPAGWPECTVRWRDGAGLLHTVRLRPDGVTVDNAPYDGGGIGKKRPKPYSQDR